MSASVSRLSRGARAPRGRTHRRAGGVARGTVRTAATQSTLPEYPGALVAELAEVKEAGNAAVSVGQEPSAARGILRWLLLDDRCWGRVSRC
jgi:hypothetical protein